MGCSVFKLEHQQSVYNLRRALAFAALHQISHLHCQTSVNNFALYHVQQEVSRCSVTHESKSLFRTHMQQQISHLHCHTPVNMSVPYPHATASQPLALLDANHYPCSVPTCNSECTARARAVLELMQQACASCRLDLPLALVKRNIMLCPSNDDTAVPH